MIVMVILMALPLLAIPVFWLLPLGQAIVVYLIALALSGGMYWIMARNHKRPVVTGKESLIGREVEIDAISRNGSRPTYTLKTEGELWTARSPDALKVGDKVIITASEGSALIIRRKDSAAHDIER
jgi:membrane protein implicated in regulation of membrane protease activity